MSTPIAEQREYLDKYGIHAPAPFLIHDALHRIHVRPPLLLCGPGNLKLAHNVRKQLLKLVIERNDVNPALGDMLIQDMYDEPVTRYPDNHAKIQIKPGCAQRQVFILQNTYPNPDGRIMEVFQIADAARRAGASEITAILPYYPYGRGDRKTAPREPIPASLIAQLLTTSGVNRIITEDIHAEQTTGSIPNPWDNLYASSLFIPELKEMVNPENTVIMGPDIGSTNRAKAYKKRLGAVGIATVIKSRDLNERASNPEALLFIGDVNGREVVIVDDESVSFSTILNAANAAVRNGAIKIIVALSHLKYANENTEHEIMLERIKAMPSEFVALLATDSIALPKDITDLPVTKVIDSSKFWAEVIWRTTFGVQLSPDLID